jgi:hypothetical protein
MLRLALGLLACAVSSGRRGSARAVGWTWAEMSMRGRHHLLTLAFGLEQVSVATHFLPMSVVKGELVTATSGKMPVLAVLTAVQAPSGLRVRYTIAERRPLIVRVMLLARSLARYSERSPGPLYPGRRRAEDGRAPDAGMPPSGLRSRSHACSFISTRGRSNHG